MENNQNEINEIKHRFDVLQKLTQVYYTVHEIDLRTDRLRQYKAAAQISVFVDENESATENMKRVMSNVVCDAHRNRILEFSDLTTIQERMKNKTILTTEFIGVNAGWVKEQFVLVEADGEGYPLVILHTTEVIAEQKQKEEAFLKKENKQSDIIHGLAGDFVAIYYVDNSKSGFDVFRRAVGAHSSIMEEHCDEDYFEKAIENGKKFVVPEDVNIFKEKFNKDKIIQKLQNEREYSFIVRVMYRNVPTYFEYKIVRPISGEQDNFVVGVYNVDARVRNDLSKQEQIRSAQQQLVVLENQASQLSLDAYRDALTALYNRRAYEEDLRRRYGSLSEDDNFIYMTIDINGLKVVNDECGHAAGDELIRGAANSIRTVLGAFGKIYRIGGDEFAAIFYANDSELSAIEHDLKQTTESWSGELVKELRVSYGYAKKIDYKDNSMEEIIKIADKQMYQNKANFYASKGIDRRGQQEAFKSICESYTKILKVNLTTDEFSIIQMDFDEKAADRGYSDRISTWLRDFGVLGNVSEDDLDSYLKGTDLEILREYFRNSKDAYRIYYKRKTFGVFCYSMMEMIPAKEYTEDAQIVFMYVKNIEARQ